MRILTVTIGGFLLDLLFGDPEFLAPIHPVVLMGRSGQEEITAEDIAGWCQTISYEILLSCGSRVERIFEYGAE